MARFIAPGPVVRSGQRAIHVDLGHWAERRRVDPMCIQPTATSARSMSFIADDQIPRRAPDRAAGRCLAQASRHALPVHDSRQRFCRSSARYPRRQVARYVVVGTTNGVCISFERFFHARSVWTRRPAHGRYELFDNASRSASTGAGPPPCRGESIVRPEFRMNPWRGRLSKS